MFIAFFLTFCRIVIGIVFVVSFLGKVRNVVAFQTTIANFRLVPKTLTKSVAVFFLLGEFIVVVCMMMGGKLLSLGFSLSIFLLVTFSAALLTILARNIQASCNCFGSSSGTVSYYDVVRNVGFVVCGMSGWIGFASNTMPIVLNLLELGLIGFVAVAFTIIWIHLGEIINLFV